MVLEEPRLYLYLVCNICDYGLTLVTILSNYESDLSALLHEEVGRNDITGLLYQVNCLRGLLLFFCFKTRWRKKGNCSFMVFIAEWGLGNIFRRQHLFPDILSSYFCVDVLLFNEVWNNGYVSIDELVKLNIIREQIRHIYLICN